MWVILSAANIHDRRTLGKHAPQPAGRTEIAISFEHPKHRMIAKVMFGAILIAAFVMAGVSIYGSFVEKTAVRGASGPLNADPSVGATRP